MSEHDSLSAPHGGNLYTYGAAISYHADRIGDTEALVTETASVSWRTLEDYSVRVARALDDRGVGVGDLVSISLANDVDCVAAVIACWKIGAVPHMLPSQLTTCEARSILDLVNPASVIGILPAGAGNWPTIADLAAASRGYPAGPMPERTSPYCRAVCSGGSTGTPKVIVDHTEARCDPTAPLYTVHPGSTALIPGPLYHSGPFLNCFWTLLTGGRVVLMRRFDAEAMLALIERYRPTYIGLVPTMMQRVWRLPEALRRSFDLSSLRRVVTSGAPCPQWLMRAWIEWLGPERLYEAYGASERAGGTLISGTEWLARPGSVGRPTLGRKLRIVDEHGRQLPPGEIGLVYMKGADDAGASFHYLGAQTDADPDGWITLGDLGWLDADGYLYLTDRRTDMIVSGGVNVFPAEIEAAVEAHPDVLSCVVIGLPDDDLGQRVHAIVEPQGSLSVDDLKAFLRERLAGFKLPKSVELVESPLRNDAGKVRRRRLREERIRQAPAG